MRIRGIIFFGLIVILLSISLQTEGGEARPTKAQRIGNWLKNQDKDGDGKIGRDEATGLMKTYFDRNDADEDGFLDEKELEALADRLSSGIRRATQPTQPRRQPSISLEAIKERTPAGVKFEGDIAYRKGNKAWKLDLAMPEDLGGEPRPAIVFVHGGGWRRGDKRTNAFLGPTLEFAAKGYVCITVNYRLTDETTKMGCVEDVKCAVRWLRAHAEQFNVDPDRIGAYGNSAGAHLVAMLGLCPPEASLEGDGPWQEYSSMIQAVVGSATPTRPRGSSEEEEEKISPMTYVSAEAPPFLLVHEVSDRTVAVRNSDDFVKALRKAGARDVTYMRYEDSSGHGVFNKNIEETGPAREAFFEKHLKFPKRDTDDAVREKSRKFFEKQDENKDGKLSRGEFSESKRSVFERVDADKDGYVTVQEDMAYRKSRSSKNGSTKRDKKGAAERRTEHDGDTRIERDIVYAVVDGSKLPLDLYIPEKAVVKGKTLPVVVWLHGGGWKGGSKGSGGIARGLVDHGYALVDVEYRLSDEALFPAQVQDCKAAVRWIRANAGKYGLDPDCIGAMGRSAGGHLVAFLGTSGDTKEFDTDSNAGYSSRVQAVVDLWGVTDILQMDAHALPGGKWKHDSAESPEGRLVGGPIQQEPYRSLAVKVNPIKYIAKGRKIPPFLIVHGAIDQSVPVHQSKLLHDALKKVGAETTLRIVEGAGHGLKGGEMDYDELCELAADFFGKHLKPGN